MTIRFKARAHKLSHFQNELHLFTIKTAILQGDSPKMWFFLRKY